MKDDIYGEVCFTIVINFKYPQAFADKFFIQFSLNLYRAQHN